MSENGARIQRGVNLWLTENWKLLVVAALVIAWGARIEGRTQDRYTSTQAEADDRALIIFLDQRLDSMHEDIVDLKEDVAFIKGQYSQEGEE